LPKNIYFMKNKAMLEGKELGAAIASAMEKKNVGPTVVAAAFGVKPPSVSDWKTRGCVKKNHLPKLIAYFSDVVGPEHWGLSSVENLFAHQPMVQEPTLNHLLIPPVNSYKAALDTLAAGLSELDMAGRERIAPMFESFARSPGPVSIQDILAVLRLNRKSDEDHTLAA
jgi:hypothetical protein